MSGHPGPAPFEANDGTPAAVATSGPLQLTRGCQQVALCCLRSPATDRGPRTSSPSLSARRQLSQKPGLMSESDRRGRSALPAMRMTARSAGSKTLPLPPEPPPPRRVLCVFPRFQGSVSPGLGELLLPPLASSATARTSWSSADMASWRGSGRGHPLCLGGYRTLTSRSVNLDIDRTLSTLTPPCPASPTY